MKGVDQVTIMQLNISKKEFLTAKEYIWTCASRNSRNGITGYNLYLKDKKGNINQITGGQYWSKKKGYHHIVAVGTSRSLDLFFSINSELGLRLEDLKQSKITQL